MPSDKTNNLELPYIYTNQAQKEVSVNDAFTTLDAVWNTGAITKTLATPPGSPATGDMYIVAATATGEWTGKEKYVAYYNNGWRFIAPHEGLRLWINDIDQIFVYNGTNWVQAENIPTEVTMLGINATPDATNKLAVASAAILFNHNGAGTQVKVNKHASTDTASFLYQDNFSGRAEIGLCGDDDFHFKVSPDGSTWNDSIIINKTSGNVSLNSHKITNVTDPTSAQDAATKAYVDSHSASLADGDKGDVVVSSSGTVWTIDTNAVTNAKAAQMAANTIKGNNTGSTANAADLTTSQVKTLLNLTGTNSGDQTITLTSDVTGSGTGSFATTIANNAVTNAKAADMAALTIKGNNTGATADPMDLTTTQVKTMLNLSNVNSGDQTITLTSDVTGSGTGSFATTIANNAVTNAKAAQMAANTIKGNNTGSTANAADLTATQTTAMLNAMVGDAGSGGTKGLVPAPAAGDAAAGKFLKADGTWATSSGSGEANTASNVNVGGVGIFKQKTGVNLEFKGVNAGSSKITVTNDTTNNEIDIDVAEANLTLSNLGGSIDLSGSKASGVMAAARMPALTGDVTNTSGSLATTIANNAVTNAKAAQMAANTIKGNNTGSTANATDLTATQTTAMLNAMVGDSGLGGTKGLVPAPASGDASAGKYLKADGTWAAPSGGGSPTTIEIITASLSSNQNDYAVSGMSTSKHTITLFRVTPTTSFKFTGISATSMENGKTLMIENVTDPFASGARMVLIERESSSSSSSNRCVYDAHGTPLILMPGDKVEFEYSTTSSRWEFVKGNRHGNPHAFYDLYNELHAAAPFGNSNTGTGSGVTVSNYLSADSIQKTIGVIDLATGTTTTGRSSIGTTNAAMLGGRGCALSITRCAPNVLSDATDTYKASVGFHDALAAAPVVDGAYWEYDQATSTDWRTVTSNNSTTTKNTVTGFTVSISTMHQVGVFCNGDWTNVEFFYSTDGDTWSFASTAHTTNIPTSTARGFGYGAAIVKSAGTTSRIFSVDHMGYRYSIKRGA